LLKFFNLNNKFKINKRKIVNRDIANIGKNYL